LKSDLLSFLQGKSEPWLSAIKDKVQWGAIL
jgi:hypothetical protein